MVVEVSSFSLNTKDPPIPIAQVKNRKGKSMPLQRIFSLENMGNLNPELRFLVFFGHRVNSHSD